MMDFIRISQTQLVFFLIVGCASIAKLTQMNFGPYVCRGFIYITIV